MSLPPAAGGVNSKVLIAIGIVVVVLLFGGAYYFLGSSQQSSGSRNLPIGSDNQDVSNEVLARGAYNGKGSERVLSEGDASSYNDQEFRVVKIGTSSISVKVGQETAIISSGEEKNFGPVIIKVNAITYSQEPKGRKVVLSLRSPTQDDTTTVSGGSGKEVNLGEGENVTFEGTAIRMDSIGQDEVSVTVGDATRAVSDRDSEKFGNIWIKVESIFYTGKADESRAILMVTDLGVK